MSQNYFIMPYLFLLFSVLSNLKKQKWNSIEYFKVSKSLLIKLKWISRYAFENLRNYGFLHNQECNNNIFSKVCWRKNVTSKNMKIHGWLLNNVFLSILVLHLSSESFFSLIRIKYLIIFYKYNPDFIVCK